MEMKENIHAGHRQRMFDRFRAGGFKGFQEHEIMEMMLFYALPRVNTNELAHRLIREYGSISAACNASTSSLLKIPELGEKGALFLHILPEFVRAFEESTVSINRKVLEKVDQAVELLAPYFIGLTVEKLYVMVLNPANRIVNIAQISEGSQSETSINFQKIMDVTGGIVGAKIIMAHNHPGSVALPSDTDAIETLNLIKMLNCVGIQLLEHIVFSASIDKGSMYDSLLLIKSGFIDNYSLKQR